MVKNKISYYIKPIIYNIRYIFFKLLAKNVMEDVWAKAELEIRKDFFEKICPEKKDKFEEAYYKVWLPLYEGYIKKC